MAFLNKLKGELEKGVDKAQHYVDEHHGLGSTVQQGLDAVKLELKGGFLLVSKEAIFRLCSMNELLILGGKARLIERVSASTRWTFEREESDCHLSVTPSSSEERTDPTDIKRDQIRKDICASHRFGSFAQPRAGNTMKWFVDGYDYFYAVSEALEAAQQSIFILDWWLTPELFLRRPPSDFPEYRLDRLLKRKAEQGVKVYVCVYKEITETMNMGSKHTKSALQALHPNIKVMRHPDHLGTINPVEYWSHHEKVVVVDNHRACIGGLDLCFGRWDSHNHPLADVHPTDFTRTLFPGQDYNNGRVLDFQQVDNYVSNQISILDTARMPWHDLHSMIGGPVVLDIVQHFVERWNKVKKEKYATDDTYAWLAFPHNVASFPTQPVHPGNTGMSQVFHPQEWAPQGSSSPNDTSIVSALTGFQPPRGSMFNIYEDMQPMAGGTCNVQVCRSVCRWSHDVPTEHSIQNAYIQLIQEAKHFIYIENQFFISNTMDKGPIVNKIAQALVARIIAAARAGQNFKVIVTIPEVPGFSGDIQQTDSIKTIMAAQWRTMNRGGNSICELISKAGFDPRNYIRFYHLRVYDRINAPVSFINNMAQYSGTSFFDAQIGQARLFIGDDTEWNQKSIKINEPSEYAPGGGQNLGTTQKQGAQVIQEVAYPASCQQAAATVKRFESSAPRDDSHVSDSVSQHMLNDRTQLSQEQWLGTPQEEKDCYVTELCYIHTKVMIVDDQRVIIGSANLNDRSQKGDGDSEIAIVIEDTDMIYSTMDGQPYQAARFAATFRRQIFKEHLGLIPPQPCRNNREPITPNMHAVPYPNEDTTQSREDQMVQDPVSPQFWNYWEATAVQNRELFSEIFKTVPTDAVRNWNQYKTFIPKVKVGHTTSNLPIDQIKQRLSGIRGALVTAPMNFLIEEKSLTNDDNPNWLGLNPTLPIYV
ncbi:hypothetical protein FRB98_007233 [Tulasnella sp. 332]|nr:hypothetical protein FRB98_007233 [Tulasnella sp. 332]